MRFAIYRKTRMVRTFQTDIFGIMKSHLHVLGQNGVCFDDRLVRAWMRVVKTLRDDN